ncbi:uncharacterized protein ATC70_009983 [Mucor velutinosus]|uniref:DUF1279 domain-containing protein n=1 Tax=Mucor velutinosus TaxID=708070 RepID=A0AAN7I2X8_9FUNG|nr:hypothetical protein ATC70_009983 [Mucor velutinosus]
MSVRSITLVRNAMVGKSFASTMCPLVRSPAARIRPLQRHLTTKPNSTTSRFFSTAPGKPQQQQQQQQASKISSMASSPSIIQAAKVKAEPKPSKLKELTKKYGAVGIIVYLGVGCVDLGITLGVIQLVGLDKVKALERGVLDIVYNTGERFGIKRKEDVLVTSDESVMSSDADDTPSFASVFILAYGIHKTLLLPVRLGITAAITPAIVRKLHQMGWARYFPRLLGATTPKKP